MIIFISDSEKCSESNDGSMFLRMNLYNKLHIGDCLAMDGGYPLFINQFKENALNLGYEFKDIHFMYPARKEKDIFGSFRSIIENEFSILVCLLKNIWQLVQDYKIEELPHHKLWHCDNFELPIVENLEVDDIVFEEEDTIMDELPRKNKKHKHPVIIWVD
ncbi:hypothetical protein RO3G_12662 [Rhizopus delemar RA 99-880]|uniref:DDE Tnp4 domain-containing protein n=1 Tax=Rhizopus delemar (strain RA 99-880 / ATCC MYA-4621 / FGSC 9543 / NRRL 43880) TaxID=246409 RepID=I1CHM1_RHIO9|nr:hypothetical protein RO3G_12662 [Rhizopus delemar RA 99-880]|eukprot:EIE87951.1 hypothetical protein RO3G_12662 [Rhizopus delemar RA 99-880]